MDALVGDVFVSTALISYCGAFTSDYRSVLSEMWVAKCKELKIPSNDKFDMVNIMGNQIRLREWSMQGLP